MKLYLDNFYQEEDNNLNFLIPSINYAQSSFSLITKSAPSLPFLTANLLTPPSVDLHLFVVTHQLLIYCILLICSTRFSQTLPS